MVELLKLIIGDPKTGILAIVCLAVALMWKEQGRQKSDIENVERRLDSKKLDKEDHQAYIESHGELHKEHGEKFNIVIGLLKELTNRR